MSSSKGPDDRQIVEILEQLCVRLNLTQAQLAEKLKVSLPTLNRWMNGRSFPRGKQRREFLAVLDQLKESQPEVFDQVQERQAGLNLKRSAPGRGMLSTKSMEQMLWDAACSIRGEKDAPKFKDYILPLVFIKRLSDVFEDEVKRLVETSFSRTRLNGLWKPTATRKPPYQSSKPTIRSSDFICRRRRVGRLSADVCRLTGQPS